MPLIAESTLLRRILAPPAGDADGDPAEAMGVGAAPAATPAPAGAPFAPPGQSTAPSPPRRGPGTPGMPLEEVLRRRESVRRFAGGTISRHELELIVRSGLLAERSQWPPDAHPDAGVTIAAAAISVDGLNPGLYLPAPAAAAFFAAVPDGGRLAGSAERYTPAPVLLLVCGDLTRASAAMGAQGYPRLLVRAGAAGYGAWLSAVSIGLAGCPFGAADHRLTTVVSRYSGGSLRHLFTIAIGKAKVAEDTHDH